MTPKCMSLRTEWWWVLIAFVLLNLSYASSQSLTRTNDGFGHDGRIYHEIAKGFPRQIPPSAPAPYVHRPGMPFLVAAVAKSLDWVLSAGFDRINILFNAVSVAGLTLLLRRHTTSVPTRLLVVFAFLIEPHSPIRHTYFSPVDLTPPTMAGLIVGLCAMQWTQSKPSAWRTMVLAGLVGLGVVFHEVLLLIGVAALGAKAPETPAHDRRWLPLTCGTASFLAVRFWAVETPSGFSGYDEIFRGIGEKSLLQYGLAWLLVFGPMAVIPVYFWRPTVKFLVDQPVLLLYMSVSALMAWSVGGDAERLIVLASPVVYLLIAQAITSAGLERMSGALLALCLLQSLSSRLFAPIGGPIDPPAVGSEVWERLGWAGAKWALSYDNMWSLTSAPRMTYLYVIWYGIIGIGIVAFLRFHTLAGPTATADQAELNQ